MSSEVMAGGPPPPPMPDMRALQQHLQAPPRTASVSPSPSPPPPPPLRAPRASLLSRLPLVIVILLVTYISVSWTWLRVYDARLSSPLFSARQREAWRVSTAMVVAVWITTAMLLWSLLRTFFTQKYNYVTREEQYTLAAGKRLEQLTAATHLAPTEEELLYDMPDIQELVPGFILELTDACTGPPLDPDGAATSSGLLSRSISMSAHSTPHILLPTLTHKINGCRRWCDRCKLYKPDRTHHCYTCGRCVKRLDHHCVFISSCIGFYNYKYFLLFIIYSTLGCALVTYDCLQCECLMLVGGGHAILVICTFVATAALLMALPLFLAFHVRMALFAGCTTLEFNELESKRVRFLGAGRYTHPFKLASLFQQWKHIFGFSIWRWPLPISVFPAKPILAASTVATIAGSEPLHRGNILRTVGRGLEADDAPGPGEDIELDELSAVPLLSSFTVAGSPITSGKALEATRELASWERTHGVPQVASQFERVTPHPIYDGQTSALYTRASRVKQAAQGVLGRAEESLVAEWQSRGLWFPVGPTVNPTQLNLWRESKLFINSPSNKQA